MAVKLRSIYYTQIRRYGQETFASATLFPESFLSPSPQQIGGRVQWTSTTDAAVRFVQRETPCGVVFPARHARFCVDNPNPFCYIR